MLIKAGTYRLNDVLTAIPYDRLQLGRSGEDRQLMLANYGADIEPFSINGIDVLRISPLNIYGDNYNDDHVPAVFDTLMALYVKMWTIL